jgi:transposase InsO family protein
MSNEIQKIIRACEECQRRKANNLSREPIIPIIPASSPLERVHMDILGPLMTNKNQYKYVLMMVDAFSKFLIAVPLHNQTASAVADAFIKNLVCQLGVPKICVTDCGSQFLSELFQDLSKYLYFNHRTSAAYHQQSNGQVERYNRTICDMISTSCKGKNWPELLPMLTFAYNSSINISTKQSPYYILHGFDPRLPSYLALNEPNAKTFDDMAIFVQERHEQLSEAWEKVKIELAKAAERMKINADATKKAVVTPFF